jgi:hypothetical protein
MTVTDTTQEFVAWRQFHEAVVTVGSYDSVQFADPVIPAVIETIFGGWPKACLLKTEELPFRHAEFLKTYRTLRKGSWPAAVPTLGLAARDNLRRGFLDHVPAPKWIGVPERGLVRRRDP